MAFFAGSGTIACSHGRQPGGCATEQTVVAGTDPVALDAYVAKADWNLDAAALSCLKMTIERSLGATKFEKTSHAACYVRFGCLTACSDCEGWPGVLLHSALASKQRGLFAH